MTSKTILSSNGVHRLHHTFFIPKGDIKATMLIVHGMSEHSGRYADFAQFLADNGILVATYDQLGHGKTVKDKYELGFFDEKHPVQALCKDVVIMADKLKEKAHTLGVRVPHFIMGHSMGSFLVRTVLTHHTTSFAGAILMGTGNRSGWFDTMGIGYLSLLNRLKPKRPNLAIAYAMNGYLLGQICTPISPSPFAWLSENPENIQAFEADPLCGFVFTNNGFFALASLIKKASSPAWFQHTPEDFGILLVSGKDDPVGGMGQDIVSLQDKLVCAGKAVVCHLYPNMRHEPLQEKNKYSVYQDILSWLLVSSKLAQEKITLTNT